MAKIYTIPNIITFVRIILIPIILYLLFSDNSKVVLIAGLLFIISSIFETAIARPTKRWALSLALFNLNFNLSLQFLDILVRAFKLI